MMGAALATEPFERRSVERLEIKAPVICRVRGRSQDAFAYDISTDGCMIEVTKTSLKQGEPITMAFPDQTHTVGQVVWVKHRNAGIRFSEPLDRLVVGQIVRDYLRRQCSTRSPVRPVKISLTPRGSNNWAPTKVLVNAAAKPPLAYLNDVVSVVEYMFLAASFVYCAFLMLGR